ncbi:MAG: hypothetical protein U1G07_24150 [Verrucomicrobiota bacterium]
MHLKPVFLLVLVAASLAACHTEGPNRASSNGSPSRGIPADADDRAPQLSTITGVMSDPQFRNVVQALDESDREAAPRSLMAQISPGDQATCGRWSARVADNGTLHLSRLSKAGAATVSPGTWRAGQGAFLFVENDRRVWAYDGQGDLFLLVASGETLISYGSPHFPCPVPPPVKERVASRPAE